MKQYRVHFKNKNEGLFTAYGFTQMGNKYFFHKKEDKSDHESFVFASEVVGIDEQPDIGTLGD